MGTALNPEPEGGGSPPSGTSLRLLGPVGLTLPTSQGSCEAPVRGNRRGCGNWKVQCLETGKFSAGGS